jgi:subtilisin
MRLRRALASALPLLLFALSTALPSGAGAESPRVRVMVELAVGTVPEPWLGTAERKQLQRSAIAEGQFFVAIDAAARRARVARVYDSLPYIALEVPEEDLAALAESDWVRSVAPDVAYRPTLDDSTEIVQADRVWDRGIKGKGWKVAVLDTGVEASHPFLEHKVVREACFSVNGTCPGGESQEFGPGSAAPCGFSGCSHGTHVAGIAVGRDSGFRGVAPAAKLVAAQVFSREHGGPYCDAGETCAVAYTSDLVKAMEWVYELGPDAHVAAVNLSLGGGYYSSQELCDLDLSHAALKSAMENLRASGIATVVAAGNNGYTGALSSPACLSPAVSVGATTKSGQVASYSNSAPFLSLLAPGSRIVSSIPGGGYGSMSGTSMATPHVTGAWALLKQEDPGAGVDTLLRRLRDTGLSLTDPKSGVATSLVQLDGAVELTLASISDPIEITNLRKRKRVRAGKEVEIRWAASAEVATVALYYTIDGGDSWVEIASAVPAEEGTYPWTAPSLTEKAKRCKVKARAYNADGLKLGADRNDHWFEIWLPD